MWRNFRCLHMTDVKKSEILHIWHVCGVGREKNVCDVENVAIYAKFIAIYAVLLQNLLFTLFCREISCGEKLSPKLHLWRKNDEYQVCVHNMKGKKMSQILFIKNCNKTCISIIQSQSEQRQVTKKFHTLFSFSYQLFFSTSLFPPSYSKLNLKF